jgi:Ca2+-binding EF-hand superfamily protein
LVRRTALAIVVGVATIGSIAAQGRASSAQGRTQMRFAALDVNKDGVITRREWNGSDRSFEVHDWNEDGILSGEEVRPGASRRPSDDDQPTGSTGRYDDWTVRGFLALDRNRDNRISREEWQSDVETFRRADANRDGVLTRPEFLGDVTTDANSSARADRDDRIDDRDVNRDRFDSLDTNNDGHISRAEWTGTAERFAVLDINRDAVVTRQELGGSQAVQRTGMPRTEAWTQGHARGLVEGRQAGKEDRSRDTWDLEGQRELEGADSGYEPRFGVKTDYQAGYREGFRLGYAEGYGRRQRSGIKD